MGGEAGRPARGPALAAQTTPGSVPRETRPGGLARLVKRASGVSSLPFPLPRVADGLARLSPAARQLGRQAAEGACRALQRMLGEPVSLEARPLPTVGPTPGGFVRVPLALAALPALAALEVEASFACRLVDRLAAGDGQLPPALELTPLEWAALELLTLVAIDGAAEVPAIAALSPRLVRVEGPLDGALCVELAISAGGLRGSARLLLPARVLPPLAPSDLPPFAEGWRLDGALVSGGATLTADDLGSLAPGDLLLLDEPPGPAGTILLGSFGLRGREEEGHFVVEELAMERPAASLPITLAVEVARVTLTLGELWRLEPGSVLPLCAPRDGRVVLRLDGRPVARGQLVEVEGALGVRVESLEGQP